LSELHPMAFSAVYRPLVRWTTVCSAPNLLKPSECRHMGKGVGQIVI